MRKLLTLLILLPALLIATNYELVDLQESFKLNKKQVTAFKSGKVITSNDLLNINLTSKMRATFARKHKLSITTLYYLVSLSDLMRISGIGPNTAKLLHASDMKNIARFVIHKNLKSLLKQMEVINQREHYAPVLPTVKQLANWQRKAKKLPLILK